MGAIWRSVGGGRVWEGTAGASDQRWPGRGRAPCANEKAPEASDGVVGCDAAWSIRKRNGITFVTAARPNQGACNRVQYYAA